MTAPSSLCCCYYLDRGILLALWLLLLLLSPIQTTTCFLSKRHAYSCQNWRTTRTSSSSSSSRRCCCDDSSHAANQHGRFVWSDNGTTYSWKKTATSSSSLSSSSTTSSTRQSHKQQQNKETTTTLLELPHCGTLCVRQEPRRLQDNAASGAALWSAGHCLALYLDDWLWSYHKNNHRTSSTTTTSSSSYRTTCLELGAGCGLPSVVAARHGVPTVVATDGDGRVLPLLRDNLQQNGATATTVNNNNNTTTTQVQQEQVLQVLPLNWTRAGPNDFPLVAVPDDNPQQQAGIVHPVWLALQKEGGADLILLSDVVYHATRPSWPGLIHVLQSLRQQTRSLRGHDPTVLLSYTQRRRDMTAHQEGQFFAAMRRAGMQAKPMIGSPIASTTLVQDQQFPLTVVMEIVWNA